MILAALAANMFYGVISYMNRNISHLICSLYIQLSLMILILFWQ